MKTQDKPLLQGAQLVKQPELITVKTISPKIVDQMNYLDGGSYGQTESQVDWPSVEIVGVLSGISALVVTYGNGKLGKVRPIAYLDYLMTNNRMTQPEAYAQLKTLPQLFAA